jgi:Tfp pilus assembly protein PilN
MIRVNLLSPEKKESTASEGPVNFSKVETASSNFNVPAIVTAVVLVLGVLGALFWLQSQKIDRLEKDAARLKTEMTRYADTIKTVDELENTRNQLKRKIEIINDLKNQQQQVVKMMDKLSEALPDWAWITELSFSSGSVSIAGKALTNNLIADFISRLKDSNYFPNVEYKDSKLVPMKGMEVYDFRLVCTYQEPGKTKEVM